jgi:DNA-binding transcriptional LysR family regulator
MTPDMQNRRILDATFLELGATPQPVIETNSVLTLSALLRTGTWSSILPHPFLSFVGSVPGLRGLPLVQPVLSHSVGLVLPDREPLSPMARGLVEVMADPGVRARFEAAGDGR